MFVNYLLRRQFYQVVICFYFQVTIINNTSSGACLYYQLCYYFIILALTNIFIFIFFRLAMYIMEPDYSSLWIDTMLVKPVL